MPCGRQAAIWSLLQHTQFSTGTCFGQCPFGTSAPGQAVYPRVRPSRRVGLAFLGGPLLRKARFRRRPYYTKGSMREGTLAKAVFRPAVSLPPASAKSGLPPPF